MVKNMNLNFQMKILKTQTLIKYGDIYAQVYSDQQSKKVLSVRFLNKRNVSSIEPYQLNSNSTSEEHNKHPHLSKIQIN